MGDGDTAARFGGGEHVQIGDYFDFAGTQPFSIEAWIKPDANQSDDFARIVAKGAPGSPRDGYDLMLAGTNLEFGRWQEDSSDTVTMEATPAGDWAHVVATYDKTQVAIFVNGTGHYAAASEMLPDSRAALRFGSSSIDTNHFQGVIDEVAIYDKALTLKEVQAHYAMGAGR